MPIETTRVMPHTHFEDFEVGQEMEYGKATMTAEEIVRFGKAFDPEPFHLSQKAARDTLFGELIASGIHMAAILRRMQVDGFANLSSQGSPEWERLQFLAPTRPGDVIHVRSRVLQTRTSNSRPTLGIVRMDHQLVDQNGQVKTRVHTTVFYKRRNGH